MNYVVDLLSASSPVPLATYALRAKTDDEAITEAAKWLRLSRSSARLLGNEPPVAGQVVRNGEVIAHVGERVSRARNMSDDG